MKNNQLVSSIFTRDDKGFSQVSLTVNYFKQIVGFDKKENPNLLPYETAAGRNSKGEKIGVRIFNIDGVKVYTSWDKENKKYVSKTSGEVTVGGTPTAHAEEPVIADPQAEVEEPDDNLPF